LRQAKVGFGRPLNTSPKLVSRARHSARAPRPWRTVAADCGVDELLAHFMLGHVPQNISQAFITRLVLAAGPALRQAQRKVSRRIIELLGADPTLTKA
jgi:hypothetical protein